MRFNYVKFKKLSAVMSPEKKEELRSRVEEQISEKILSDLQNISFGHVKSKTFEDSMRSKKGFKNYIDASDVFFDTWARENLKIFGELRKGFKEYKNSAWYRSIEKNPEIISSIKVSSYPKDLIEEFKSTQSITDPVTGKTEVVCYFCGRGLFNTMFDDRRIQIEHLTPKTILAEKLTQGANVLVNVEKSPVDLQSPENKEAISYIKTVIESNAVNSLSNWAMADGQCNACKQTLNQSEFIYFMGEINKANTAAIISKNKSLYEEAKNSRVPFNPEASSIFENKKSKCNQLFLQTVLDAIEGSDLKIPSLEESQLTAQDSARRISRKFLRLVNIPDVRKLFLEQDYKTLVNNFNQINMYTDEIRANKQILFFLKDKLDCPVCGNAIKNSSPVNKKQSYQIVDVTISVSDIQNQLIHTDCLDFVAILSLPALKGLAKMVTDFTPQRDAMAKEKQTLIENMFRKFDDYVQFLKKQISDFKVYVNYTAISRGEKTSFNLFKFLRIG